MRATEAIGQVLYYVVLAEMTLWLALAVPTLASQDMYEWARRRLYGRRIRRRMSTALLDPDLDPKLENAWSFLVAKSDAFFFAQVLYFGPIAWVLALGVILNLETNDGIRFLSQWIVAAVLLIGPLLIVVILRYLNYARNPVLVIADVVLIALAERRRLERIDDRALTTHDIKRLMRHLAWLESAVRRLAKTGLGYDATRDEAAVQKIAGVLSAVAQSRTAQLEGWATAADDLERSMLMSIRLACGLNWEALPDGDVSLLRSGSGRATRLAWLGVVGAALASAMLAAVLFLNGRADEASNLVSGLTGVVLTAGIAWLTGRTPPSR
jgi:hypothetical protein